MSALGMMTTVLATQLDEALKLDGHPIASANAHGATAAPIGEHTAAWLRLTAAEYDTAQRTAAAYRWAYGYLQDRMRSIGRDGWAEDCDSEIEARIRDVPAPGPSSAP